MTEKIAPHHNHGPANIQLQTAVVALSVVLLAAKFFAWLLTDSDAILTDALESIINVVAGSFTLWSLTLSARPRDRDHPYGHGKIEFVAAGAEGLLIATAGISIVIKAVDSFFHPPTLQSLDLGMIIIAAGGALNWGAGMVAERRGKKVHSLALQATGKHLQSDAYSTVGVVIGVFLVWITDAVWVDAATAGLFGLLILTSGARIIRGSLAGIMDEADEELLQRVVQVLQQGRHPEWIDIHNLRIIKYGAVYHIDCHLTLPWYFNLHQAHTQVDIVENLVDTHVENPVELFIHVDPCRAASCSLCSMAECPERQHPYRQQVAWTLDNLLPNKRHDTEINRES